MADVSALEALLNDELIGTLTRVAGDRALFAFSGAYFADEYRPKALMDRGSPNFLRGNSRVSRKPIFDDDDRASHQHRRARNHQGSW